MNSRSCTGVVLAGGASSRFGGTRKGFLPLGGARIVDRVLAAVGAAADEVLVISNDPAVRGQLPGLCVYGDARPERGSLTGLHSALIHAKEGAIVVAWDMPFVSAELLRELRRMGEGCSAAVIPEGPRGPEPLCAYYTRACLTEVERALDDGNLRLGQVVDALPSRVVMPFAAVARFGDPERLFTNVNSPMDLTAAEQWLDAPPATRKQDLRNRDTLDDSFVR